MVIGIVVVKWRRRGRGDFCVAWGEERKKVSTWEWEKERKKGEVIREVKERKKEWE